MSSYLEEQVLKVDLLLDIMEGEHLLSRNETAAAPSGAGPAGYELCPAWPQCLGEMCRSCDGSGYVKRRHGRYDPYLPKADGPVSERTPIRDGTMPAIKTGEGKSASEILARAWEKRNVQPPPTREPAVLNKLEHRAASDQIPRLRRSLETLSYLMNAAEDAIVQSALRRERPGLEWFAKRLPRNAWVPGL